MYLNIRRDVQLRLNDDYFKIRIDFLEKVVPSVEERIQVLDVIARQPTDPFRIYRVCPKNQPGQCTLNILSVRGLWLYFIKIIPNQPQQCMGLSY